MCFGFQPQWVWRFLLCSVFISVLLSFSFSLIMPSWDSRPSWMPFWAPTVLSTGRHHKHLNPDPELVSFIFLHLELQPVGTQLPVSCPSSLLEPPVSTGFLEPGSRPLPCTEHCGCRLGPAATAVPYILYRQAPAPSSPLCIPKVLLVHRDPHFGLGSSSVLKKLCWLFFQLLLCRAWTLYDTQTRS